MSSYFTLPSFARAKKNREDLEKTNPTNPVLNDADEKFLTRITSQEAQAPEAVQNEPPVQITDDGKEQQIPQDEAATAGDLASPDQIALPETQPEEVAEGTESKQGHDAGSEASGEESVSTEAVPDPPEVTPGEGASETQAKKGKKNKTFELPSQEEAEAATRGFDYDKTMSASDPGNQQQHGEKRTWASYLPNLSKSTTLSKDSKEQHKDATEEEQASQASQPAANKTAQAMDQARTWAQYASTYIPSTSSLPSIPSNWSFANRKDFRAEPVYKEDGSIDEVATKEKQEKEVSVLLDNLSLSNINNRVFSFSNESQKYYDRFTQVLKDTLNGAPTAYEDMDKLMKEAGPTLEKHFNNMPPFVQTLVKSLPAKLGTTLGPELMAAASEKPGNDMKARMAASNEGTSTPPAAEAGESSKDGQKKKRRIPGLKSLTSSNGVVASILRNIVNFLQVRFPFLVSTTNVVMSLAVFILMFVFWYCHKRGKQVRIDRENETKAKEAAEKESAEDDFDGSDFDATDSDSGDVDGAAERIVEAVKQDQAAGSGADKDNILNQPDPAQVPLPGTEKGEKGAALEAEKSVGV